MKALHRNRLGGRRSSCSSRRRCRAGRLCPQVRRLGVELLEARCLLSVVGQDPAIELFSTSPALFVENQGQWADESVRFLHQGDGVNVAMTDAGAVFQLFQREPAAIERGAGFQPAEDDGRLQIGPTDDDPFGALHAPYETTQFSVSFDGANAVEPVGLDRAATRFNYFLGDQDNWHANVPSYEVVAYEGLYEGIDFHTWGKRSHLKYEFHVAPGADYRQIQVRYEGIEGLSLDDDGALHVQPALASEGDSPISAPQESGQSPWGELVDDAPYIYQVIDGQEVEVAGRFALVDAVTYAFTLTGSYNPSVELIIDPSLDWSSYLGGSGLDMGEDVAVDAWGGAWVTGGTASSGWVSGGSDTSYGGGGGDAFVSRLNSSGVLLWSTYLGGGEFDWGSAIAVGNSDNTAWVTGETHSLGWVSGGDIEYGGEGDAFVAQISDTGNLLWSSYLGGSGEDYGRGIAMWTPQSVMVTGATESGGWLDRDAVYHGNRDAFVAQVSSQFGLVTGCYLGGSEADEGYDVAVDGGYAWVTGSTESSDLAFAMPGTAYRGNGDGFVARIAPFLVMGPPQGGWEWSGWSKYLGGIGPDEAYGIAVGPGGNGWVVGSTRSGWFHRESPYHGGGDAFVIQINPYGRWRWGTHLGGTDRDEGRAIAVDASGTAWVTGETESTWWTSGGFDTSHNGEVDAFVARINSIGQPLWSSYLGGAEDDSGWGIAAVGPWFNASAWVTGWTGSPDWVWGGFDASYNGAGDGFVALVRAGGVGPMRDLEITNGDVTLSPEGDDVRVTATVHNRSGFTIRNVPVRFFGSDVSGFVEEVIIPEIPGWGSADASVLWTPRGPGSPIVVVVDSFDVITETNEGNNQVLLYWGGTKPVITSVDSPFDADPDPSTFGRYVSGANFGNEFYATVADADEDISRVEFTLGPLGTERGYWRPGKGYVAPFDMHELSGDATLTVVAYDVRGNVSDPWTGTVHVVPFPSWLGTPSSDDYFDRGLDSGPQGYHLTGFFPESMETWWDTDDMIGVELPFIGGTASGYRFGIESTVFAPLSVEEEPQVTIAAVAEAKLFDYKLLEERFTPESHGEHFHIVATVDVDGDSLELEGLQIDSWVAPPYRIFDFSIGPADLFAYGVRPIAAIYLEGSAGIHGDLDASLSVYFDGSGIDVLEARVGLDVTGWGKLKGGVEVLGIDLVSASAGIDLTLSPELSYTAGDWDFDLDGSLRISWTASLLWWDWSGYVPDETGWEFSLLKSADGTFLPISPAGEHLSAEAGLTTTVLPMLSGDQDIQGNSILVRTVDTDPDPDAVNSDVYYTFRRAGQRNWTPLAPLAESSEWLTSPEVALDGRGGAVAVWVANDMPRTGAEEPDLSEAFRSQDVYGAYFDGRDWSAPIRITDDNYADGQPAVACDPTTGDAMLVWTRSLEEDATDRSGFEIAYATWDRGTQSWSAPALLASDSAADWSPKVAFNDASQTVAIWPRDTDGDLTTVELAYSQWDGKEWSSVAVSNHWQQASDMAITATPDGSFLVAAVAGAQRANALLSAFYDPLTGVWSAAESVASGGVVQSPQSPRLRVNDSGTVVALWQGVGANGNNDLWMASRDSGAEGDWTSSYRLTDDADIEWMPVLLFDEDGDPYAVYELIEEAGGAKAPVEAKGMPNLGDDVGIAAANLGPDLTAENVEVMATPELKQARLTVDVANRGLTSSGATTVNFYLGDPDAGGIPVGDPIDVAGLVPGESTYAVSSIFTPPVGANDYYAVVTPDPDEAVTDNNTARRLIDRAPPDVTGPRVTVDLPAEGVVPAGTGVLTLSFDEPIASLAASSISLVEDTWGIRPPDHVYLSPNRRSGTLIFEGGLAAGSYTLKVRDSVMDLVGNALDGDGDGNPGGDHQVLFVVVPAEVVDRHIFYNNSAFDGNDAAADDRDDAAIAPDKAALLPGQTAGFANYTSYSRGINGIMVDLARPTGAPTIGDFRLKVGNDDNPAGWGPIFSSPRITVRPGEGVDGSDRVTIVFDDNVIRKQWLQVTVLAENTGLAQDDVFYYGNAIGESGNSATDAKVNATDMLAARNNPHNFFNPAPLDDFVDFDRDQKVNATDMLIARNNTTNFFTALKLIAVPPAAGDAVPGGKSAESRVEGLESRAEGVGWRVERSELWAGTLDWLYEFEQIRVHDRPPRKDNAAERAVDMLWTDDGA